MFFKKSLFEFFENLIPPFYECKEEVPPRHLTGFVRYFSSGLKKFFLAIAVLNSLIAFGEALFFACLGSLVDWTSSSHPSEFISEHGLALFLMLLGVGILLPLATVLHSLLIHQTLSSNYSMMIRYQLHSYLLGQSLSFFSDEFAGSLANKVMQTSIAMRTAVMKLIDVTVHLVVYISTMIFMLVKADFYLCLPLMIWIIAYILSLVFFIPHIREASKIQSKERSRMVGRIVDSYTNIVTVKLFGGFGREKNYARESMDDYRQSEYRTLRIITMFDISVGLMNYTLLISLVMISIWLWSNYLISSGAIAVAVAIAIRMMNMSRWIMWEAGAIFENLGMVYDGISTISKPISVRDPVNPQEKPEFKDKIEFKNVFFSYSDSHNVIENLNLEITKGTRLGIVGASGSGKSTLVHLLLRFYDVKEGSICIDGVDIRNFRQDNLRELFSVVSQDSSLMHRTIGENIEYGAKNELNASELMKAARESESLNFIEQLSDYRGNNGFDSLVGDRGVKLSGGQKQRIAIARVMVKNAPVLILDEATSALDSKTENVIKENLDKIMEDRTVIAIAHRLSTLKSMDRIIVLSEGRIVEQGSHDELLSKNGEYRKLWDLQMSKQNFN